MKNKVLTKNMLKSIKERLLQQQAELEIAAGIDFLDPSSQGSDEVDVAQSLVLNDMAERLSLREKELARKISRALQKIENDDFGTCEECELEIGHKRIEIMPLSTLCVICAENLEKRAKQYRQ